MNDALDRLIKPPDSSDIPVDKLPQLTMCNTVFLIGAALGVLASPVFYATLPRPLFLSCVAVTLGFAAAYRLSRRGKSRLAGISAIASLDLSVAISTHVFGPGLFDTAYLFSVCVAFLVFPRETTGTMWAVIAATLVLAVVSNYTASAAPDMVLEPSRQANLRSTMVVLIAANMIVVLGRHLASQRATASQLHRALAESRSVNAAKDRFFANISHEIRTPMNGVLGMLDILADSPLDKGQRECVSTARAAGNALLDVVSDILDLAKIESGRFMLDSSPFSLRALIEDGARHTRNTVAGKDLAVVVEYPPEVPEQVIGDGRRVRQLVGNLLSNAAKFTDKGSIRVAVRCEDVQADTAMFHISVADTGCGISPAEKAMIFERFRQVDSSTTRRQGGTGLGLTLVKELATRMNGAVAVDSTPGRGSTFRVSIALRRNPGDAPRAAKSRELLVCNARVLVVDDNVINQKVAVRMLHKLGCCTDIAGNGREAMTLMEQRPFDMVFMDIQMPEVDGLTAAAMIRAREAERGGHVPIVALSAHAMVEERHRCLAAGMDEYMSKPLQQGDLMAIMARFCAQAIDTVHS